MAQGFRQIAGNSHDPDTISSPVVRKDSLRMFLSLSAGLDLRIRQLDVTAAFLQSKLQDSERLLDLKGMSSPVRF